MSWQETRHYIGLTEMGRVHMTLCADDPAEFKTAPTEPLTLANGSVLYPVSAEVGAEWDSHDDEDPAEAWDDPTLYEQWTLQGQPIDTVTTTGELL